MQDYVLDFNGKQKGTAWEGRADEEMLNTDVAHAIGVRSAGGNQRAGVSNFVIDGLNEEIKVKVLKIKIKNATKKGYDEAIDGDSVNLQYPESTTRRGRVGHGVSQTLMANDSMGVVLKSKDIRLKTLVNQTNFEEGKVLNLDLYNQTTNENLSQCLTEPHHNTQRLFDGYRIRKLTPKECWRLMGFDDEDFEKAQAVPMSNTQLYKQARKLNLCTSIRKNF